MVAKWSKVTCNLSTDCSHQSTLVRIPAQDYAIDLSGVEILCRFSNSRAPCNMCCLQYRTKRRCYQAHPMCLSISIIPILQWRRIDGAVWLNQEPALDLHSRASPSVKAHHLSIGPDAGGNPRGRWIKKTTTST